MKTFQEIREQQEQIKAKMAKMKDLVKPKLDIKGKLKKILGKLPGADAAKKLAEADPIGFKEGKYLKYSDLLLAKSRLLDKEGPNSPAMKKIDKAIAKEMKKLGIEGIWVKEGKMIWNHNPTISDGTMQMGIFDSDKGKAEEAARQLIFFLRKNKKTKIGKSDPEQNDSNADIAKYSEELSKLIFDDKMLDDLEPNGNNENQNANDLVIGRLRDLGVRIK